MAESSASKAMEYVKPVLIALLLMGIVRLFLFQGFKIPTESMRSTLEVGDQILVSRISYGIANPAGKGQLVQFSGPARGDVIVFRYPYNPILDASRQALRDMDFVKRVVAVPGDVVEIRAKKVFVNGYAEPEGSFRNTGKELAPPPDADAQLRPGAQYFDHCEESAPGCMTKRDWLPRTTVPPGRYFVLGDNRDESYDSRFWGFVPREQIIGKALLIYWSRPGGTVTWARIGRKL